MKWLERKPVLFLLLTLSFAAVYTLNNALTAVLWLVPGAHVVHIPSGVKLLMVLVFERLGALSIAVVSLMAGLFFYFPGQVAVSLELALSSALAPLLAVRVMSSGADMDDWIGQLHLRQLMGLGLVYAVLNSGLNQLVIYWNGLSQDLLSGLGVMLVGDVTGVWITLGLVQLIWRRWLMP